MMRDWNIFESFTLRCKVKIGDKRNRQSIVEGIIFILSTITTSIRGEAVAHLDR